jgi:excisionase family DNA binding protein
MSIAPDSPARLCLTVGEAAVVLTCSRRQVYRLLASDVTFPWVTFGSRRWVPVDGLREWVRAKQEH